MTTVTMAGLDHESHSGSHHHDHDKQPHHQSHHHHTGPIKFKLGISVLSWIQIIGGVLILNFEAICSVLYITNASANESLHGTEFAGIYVGIFSQITGAMGLVSLKKHGITHFFRSCFHVTHIILTVFLAVQAFGMCCASGAMLVFFVAGWDTILAFVNRVSQTAELNFAVGTTTTTMPTTTLPLLISAEITQDRNVIVGLRSTLFALYFFILASAIIASCFACCNYCRCWNMENGNDPEFGREITVTTLAFDRGDGQGTIEAAKKERRVSIVPLGEPDHPKGQRRGSREHKHRHEHKVRKDDPAKYH